MTDYSLLYDYVGECFWCEQSLYDARDASGCDEPDYATNDGDFGCDCHPMTNIEGVWSHETEAEVRVLVRKYYAAEIEKEGQ